MIPKSPDFYTILYFMILGQGIFLTISLALTKRGNRVANRYLALMMLIFSSALLEIVLKMAGYIDQLPHILYVSTPFWYLLGPSYYFYVRNLLTERRPLSPRDLLHLIPYLIVLVRFSFIYAWPTEMKIAFYYDPDFILDRPIEKFLFALLYDGQSVVYLFLSLQLLRQAREEAPVLNWIKLIYAVLSTYCVINLIDYVFQFVTGDSFLPWGMWAIPLFAVLIYSVAFLAFVRPEKIFQPPWVRTVNSAENQAILARLTALMESERPYLEPGLRYSEIATRLGVSTRALSRALREEAHQSFNDFVNAYRVNAVKKQLNQVEEEESLLAIALRSGFSGKSSFNRIFKEHTGLTPSEFLRSPAETPAQ